jgi:hypothetical protein
MRASFPNEVDGILSIFWVDISDDLSSGRRENPGGRVHHHWIDPITTDDQIGSHRPGVKSAWHGLLSMVCTIVIVVLLRTDSHVLLKC